MGSKYGSHFLESEAILAATLGDGEFIKECLNDMSTYELVQFQTCLEGVWEMVVERLAIKGIRVDSSVRDELDKVIEANT